MHKLKNYLRLIQPINAMIAEARGTFEGLTVNPQVPGSNPGRGAKKQILKPQKCGFFLGLIGRILDVSKMAGENGRKKRGG